MSVFLLILHSVIGGLDICFSLTFSAELTEPTIEHSISTFEYFSSDLISGTFPGFLPSIMFSSNP